MAHVIYKPLLMILWKVYELNGAWSLIYPGETSYRRKDKMQTCWNKIAESCSLCCYSGQPAIFCIQVGELLPINTTKYKKSHRSRGRCMAGVWYGVWFFFSWNLRKCFFDLKVRQNSSIHFSTLILLQINK